MENIKRKIGTVEIKGVTRNLTMIDCSFLYDENIVRVMWLDEKNRRVTSFLNIENIEIKILNKAPDEIQSVMDNKAKKKKCHATHAHFMLCTKHPDDNDCGDCEHLR